MIRYRIYCGQEPLVRNENTLLLDTQDPTIGAEVSEASLDRAINKAGGLTVKLLRSNPFYSSITLMRTVMEVWDEGSLRWKGRIIKISPNQDGSKTVEVEGNLNYLMDIPDVFTNPPEIAKHYKLGSEVAYKNLSFTETAEGSGLFFHAWTAADDFEWIYTYERGAVIYVQIKKGDDVNTYDLTDYEGHIGNVSIIDDTYVAEKDDPGSSVDFYINNDGMYTSDGDNLLVKIWRRDKMSINQMFRLMFDENAHGVYNDYAWVSSVTVPGIDRRLYAGTCDIVGSMIYDPAPETTCLDTLRAWQEIYGGYIYTSYDSTKDRWLVNYTQNIGRERSDVPVEYGLNITGIEITQTAESVVTDIHGIGEDDETGKTFWLSTAPAMQQTGFTLDTGSGYVTMNSALTKYGHVRKQRYYTIHHGTSNKFQDLYDLVVADLMAQDGVESVRVSAFDARLVDSSAVAVDIGDRCSVNAAPWGINNQLMRLTDMRTDMIQPERGVLQFGAAQKTLTEQIKQ